MTPNGTQASKNCGPETEIPDLPNAAISERGMGKTIQNLKLKT